MNASQRENGFRAKARITSRAVALAGIALAGLGAASSLIEQLEAFVGVAVLYAGAAAALTASVVGRFLTGPHRDHLRELLHWLWKSRARQWAARLVAFLIPRDSPRSTFTPD